MKFQEKSCVECLPNTVEVFILRTCNFLKNLLTLERGREGGKERD